jgi:hypothetical protein
MVATETWLGAGPVWLVPERAEQQMKLREGFALWTRLWRL